MRSALFITILALLPACVAGDSLEITRAAKLKSEPTTDSDTVAQLAPPTRVRIIDAAQQNGYYHVTVPESGQTGWVYRTLGRRSLDDATPAGGAPSAGSPAFAGRIAAAKG